MSNCDEKTMFVESEDDIVISGFAGRFPACDNIRELQEALFTKADLGQVDKELVHDHPDLPQRIGRVRNLNKFDSKYFDIPVNQAHFLDPMMRMIMEHTYEAIVDAGVNPNDLSGTRTGVFIGACYTDMEKTSDYEKKMERGYELVSYGRYLLSNTISNWLNIKGPCYTIDSACSSSLFTMALAYRSLKSGECDAAIVGGMNLCLNHFATLQFARLGVLSFDGICRPFDEDAQGYMRSDTIAVVFLQKANVAKRIYSTFVYAKTNCDGYKEQGITYPSAEMQGNLLKEFYNECGISPTSLEYLEAHGTGTKVGDPEEVSAIEHVFCKNRSKPLLIGSIKSNLGHSEPSSGMCQIAKAIIMMEAGVLLPTINFKQPRKDIKAFAEGKIKVVTDITPWNPGFIGINSFGFGGANCHILLRAYTKEKVNGGAPSDKLPRLIVISGRTEEAVASFLNEIKNRPIDVEFVRLLHDLYASAMINHPYRGYAIIDTEMSNEAIQEIKYYSDTKPICFVFSGIGSQWLGMGQALLEFPVFCKTVEKCDTILRTRGINVIDILINKTNEAVFDNILNSLVGITVMQIGLIDLLMSINITPDYAIGYSIGELCCGYVTGNFTIEQVILSAYYIGLALSETKIVNGAMAEIGLSYENLRNICPPDIEIIGSNSRNNSSISGPKESVKAFVTKLQVNNVSAKEINCSNIPFHTRYLAPAKAAILTYLKRIISQTMTPNEIWRNSVHQAKSTHISCAEYFTHNLLTPVLFDEVARSISENAVALEIAPDGILQDVTAERFDTSVALLQRNREDIKVFLQGIGQLYNCGSQPRLANLYPAVQFPVSRGTPMISPSIKWDHSDDWYVTNFQTREKLDIGERLVEIHLNDEDYEFITGHVIDGRNLFPATGYLFLVWQTIEMLTDHIITDVPIVFEDVKFVQATQFQGVEFTIMLQKVSGKFEILERNNILVTGVVRVTHDIQKEKLPDYLLRDDDDNKEEMMSQKDFYKELRLRGYQYSGLFRGIKSASIDGKRGHIHWSANWVTFMDCMLQMKIIGIDTRSLYVPTRIEKVVIDPQLHMQLIRENPETVDHLYSVFPVRVYRDMNAVIAGGIEIRGINANAIFRRKSTAIPVLEEYRFVAHRDHAEISLQNVVILSTHLALECHPITKITITELVEDGDEVTAEQLLSPLFLETLGNLPLIQPNITLVSRCDRFNNINNFPSAIAVSQSKMFTKNDNAIIIAGFDLLAENKHATLKKILPALKDGGFLMTRGKSLTKSDIAKAETLGLQVILEKRTSREHVTFLNKQIKSTRKTEVIYVDNCEFSWLEELQSILNAQSQSINVAQIILVAQADSESGLLGLLNCLRREPGGETIKGVFIEDETAPKFSLHDPLYAEQLKLDLPINVLHPGKIWGSYRHLPLAPVVPKLVYNAFVNQLVRADLNSFAWIEDKLAPDYRHEDLVYVVYAPLNFKDIMLSTGKIILDFMSTRGRLEDCFIGLEYSGFEYGTGRRVIGICENRCLTNLRVIEKTSSWYIPDHWTLEEAATIPCAYSTFYYALMRSGELKKGEKILIHSGTGAVGQAAINVALYYGCEVFTTVGTQEKRKFIRDTFPTIPDDHIGNSRDTTFEQMIFKQTKGRGVDIVLNSLAEEKLQASIRCLAKKGRFLEIGKFDFMVNNTLDMSIFAKGIQFHSIMLDNIFSAPIEKRKKLCLRMASEILSGAIKPICRKVFSKDEVENAFRYMAAGKHIGKVIIKVQEEDQFVPDQPILALPRYYCRANKSYVILGGLGGFGLELADWLVLRDARNLVLVSRVGIKNGYQQMKIELWKSYGVRVSVLSNLDASNADDCELILRTAEDLAPVDGIFNLAVALNDKIFLNHTAETFQEPFRGKAWATKHLDQLSRKLCPQLRHFVVFSSVSCGRGNLGQSNYGMANSIMERICERRMREGLHGLAIQWGAVGDVGLVADMQDNDKEMVIGGTLQQKILSCIENLEKFLLQEQPVVASMVVAEKRSNVLGTNIVETVANIMSLKDLKTVARHTPLSELGMDSMMAVEIRQTLEREYDVFLSAQDIRNLTFAKLSDMFDVKDPGAKIIDKDNLIGLKALVRMIGDETLRSDICIDLLTKESKTKKGPIFLLPGLEGAASVFDPLVSKIEGSATTLQYNDFNIGSTCYTISDISDRLFKELSNKDKLRQNFVLVGYSYGSSVALELAHRFEKANLEGRIVLIDGAPKQMKILANQHLPLSTIEEFQNNILLSIMDNYLQPAISGKLLLELHKCKNWNEKLTAFVTSLPMENKKSYPIEYQMALCTTIYNRMLALHKYDLTQIPKIKSPVILLKPTLPSTIIEEEDYDLQKITQGDVDIHYIEGNHFTILDSDNVIAAINGEHIENIKRHLRTNIISDEILSGKDDRTRS